MKKFFTLFTLALMSLLTVKAQSSLQFVDAEGNVLADGATITMNTAEANPMSWGDGDEMMVALHGISIKNTSASAQSVYMNATVKEMSSGVFQCCFGTQCKTTVDISPVIPIEKVTVKAGESKLIENTEWIIADKAYGTCLIEFQLGVNGVVNGPKLLVNFVYADPAASLNATSAGKQVVARYSIVGKQVSSAIPGITLVRYADGSVRKVLTK